MKAAVIGASGYTGEELFRILAVHPNVKIEGAHAIRNAGREVSEVHPNLRGIIDLRITKPDYEKIGKTADIVFTAVPHKVAMKIVPKILRGKAKVVDLSADYRFDDVEIYERHYVRHESPKIKGVYGLPEIHRDGIRSARLVANPGCFPTAAILSLAPLVRYRLIDLRHIVIDAKTGTSGAGAIPSEATHHPLIGSNVRAYAATSHRHSPEIDQELGKLARKQVKVHFTPHLVPIVRGILSTAHVFLKKRMRKGEILNLYRNFYAHEPFVRVVDGLPEVNFVVGSNYCDIGIEVDADGERAVVVSAIDNLTKGASGQAVQNMNLMFGIDEIEGLRAPPQRP
ncbi:MAG: N-acetyl-gamma-glutamyl-phosphate reductase [Hadesarchaea archaeon]|nr:MAG: N-acetyl-gamma-glutamyl-phosphate reductase [Hadesarchaea archaeon]